MQLDKFIRAALEKGAKFDNDAHGMPWHQYKKLAALTKHVEFHCDFDSHGRCTMYNNDKYHPVGAMTMCCCQGCFYNMGYLYSFPTGGWGDNFTDLKTYTRHFSEKKISANGGKRPMGFWRPGKGCILPRKLRSPTCLGYDCARDNKKRSVWEKKLFRLLNTGRYLKFPITIRGQEYKGYDVSKGMIKWHEELNDKNNSK